MKDFKAIAEKILSGEMKGDFVLRNGNKIPSSKLHRLRLPDYPYFMDELGGFNNDGNFVMEHKYDVVDFIEILTGDRERLRLMALNPNASAFEIDFGRKFWFGKYKGRYIYCIIVTNPPYIEWLLNNTQFTLTEDEKWWKDYIYELVAEYRLDNLVSSLSPYFGEVLTSFDGDNNPHAIIE